VAFNSHNQSLLTIMMSNNFVELKGAVFKKFGKPNLFQMACSDVRGSFLRRQFMNYLKIKI
jgi:transmembrane anterior posterior transformation protein 1